MTGVSRNAFTMASYSSDESEASLSLGSRTAVVTAETVTLEDGRVLTIPRACRQVLLEQTGDGLRVSFDGAPAR